MNLKTLLVGGLLIGTLAIISVVSYTGIGLPTQHDQLSIRQSSIQNQRNFRGGGTHFGK